MAKERTHSGKLGDWQRLTATVQANSADLPHLETSRVKLEALLAQAVEITKEQGALRAGKQEKSQQLRTVIAEGSRLATFLRAGIKTHYGPAAEKLAEFGVQPFRGRRKAKAEPEAKPDTKTGINSETKPAALAVQMPPEPAGTGQ